MRSTECPSSYASILVMTLLRLFYNYSNVPIRELQQQLGNSSGIALLTKTYLMRQATSRRVQYRLLEMCGLTNARRHKTTRNTAITVYRDIP